ncbi:MAG: hypothetical protein AVDCRST_MAG49-2267 [uncultured Thermomicrobiales bacterium]|uniref:Uncharacterized protein n=1 Tax=uncultured Thermomicrobiales bacterium TaxID=1645740 RepID=A0A6J4UU54_9BACT|nr:MAG: hypothetical protein AVDCRST_MAG49-2267 [uncultured Thermomicrobiales bacterium]
MPARADPLAWTAVVRVTGVSRGDAVLVAGALPKDVEDPVAQIADRFRPRRIGLLGSHPWRRPTREALAACRW